MAFAPLTDRSCLRDSETCLRAQTDKLYHMGIHSGVARSTRANANSVRDWRLDAAFAQPLIPIVRQLDQTLDRNHTVYALDSSPID